MPLSLEIQLACRTLALRAARLTAEQARRNAMAKGGEFWQEIADSVQVHEEPDSVVVGATHVAAAIRHFGGRISAPGQGAGSLHRRALTIPIYREARAKHWSTDDAEAAGWTLFKPKGSDIIYGTKKGKGKGNKAQTEMLFVLRKSVRHPASPWWPSDADVQSNIDRALSEEFPSS